MISNTGSYLGKSRKNHIPRVGDFNEVSVIITMITSMSMPVQYFYRCYRNSVVVYCVNVCSVQGHQKQVCQLITEKVDEGRSKH